ncbi:MAG: GDSL-type esterase/lipase family protein [Chitinophagales bacterium]
MKISFRNSWKNIKAVCFGTVLALVICEIFLQIYNPFPFFIKEGKLILPANQKKIFINPWIKKLDKKIYYSRNSLGFRGPELPDSISKLVSILTIGGSTTECRFLSDSCTWPFILYQSLKKKNASVWLNNAGIDGHSTFGNLLLLDEYALKLKPDYALFLIGINDIETDGPDEFDLMTEKKISTESFKGFIKSLLNHTELGRTAFNFYHIQLAYRKGLIHREISIPDLVDSPVPDSVMNKRMENQNKYLRAYRERVREIISKCLNAGIRPVLITQSSLFGDYTDSATHIEMGNKWIKGDRDPDNCRLEGKILNLYNDVLRSFKDQCMIIDLASEMPKNSSYYYDFIHYTNAGAKKTAEIIFSRLWPVISNRSIQ